MRGRLRTLALGLAALAICSSCAREIRVREVSRDETFTLQKRASQGQISELRFAASGSLEGRGEVQLMLNGAIYKREAVHGSVNFEWRGDWYSDQAEIRYVAGTVSKGALTFQYDFKD